MDSEQLEALLANLLIEARINNEISALTVFTGTYEEKMRKLDSLRRHYRDTVTRVELPGL